MNNIIDFSSLTFDAIQAKLKEHQLGLTVDEALTIQNKFLKRPPTLAECVLWSIQGSEHCSYKSTRHYLKTMVTEGPNVILGAKEDAGIVSVATDKKGIRYGIVMSHESHNHPSQIVPYEGAATGVGGNVRDVSCMGAEVIALADGLRFGDIHRAKTRWIHENVVDGIGGYGNSIGVPNIAGDLYYHPQYNDNCLVTVVTLGVVREDHIIHSYAPKHADQHVYILVGKATDNSGFGGASFASATLEEKELKKNKGAVQEPDAFLKRHLLKANTSLFEKFQSMGCIERVGFKDLGAGGIACASVELAHAGGYGANIDIDKVPVSMKGLAPHVILCSETQERFLWLVPPEFVEMVLAHYNDEFALPSIASGATAAVVGHLTTDGRYTVHAGDEVLVDAQASDITQGILYNRPTQAIEKAIDEPALPDIDVQQTLLQLLGHENIASRLPVMETYDKQVQGRTLIEAGESDAGVLMPFNDLKYPEEIRKTGVALSLDQNPRFNQIDPYWGAVNAVVESARNVVATGADPQAITDCLCFGNPEHPEQMWAFSESVRGINDACKAIGLKEFPNAPLPIIAGNVSLYNESQTEAIPPSPMISCLGSMPDATRAISSHLQKDSSLLIMIGERLDECGGSVFYQLHGALGQQLPKPNLGMIANELHVISALIQSGLILSAHDISDGGIAVALAEMTFDKAIGIDVKIPSAFSNTTALFSESGGFVLEVSEENWAEVEQQLSLSNLPFWLIGHTTPSSFIKIQPHINLPIHQAKSVWENGLREKLL